MKQRGAIFAAAAVALMIAGGGLRLRSSSMRKPPPAPAAKPQLTASVSQLPLSFELNEGQLDPRVLYATRASGGGLFFTHEGLTLAVPQQIAPPPQPKDPLRMLRRHPAPSLLSAMRLVFDGANPNPEVVATDPQPGIKNYFIGNDPTQWHTHVPLFGKVTYRGLYPGVDLVFYGSDRGGLEYDLDLAPGADLDRVRFRFEGAESQDLKGTDLVVHGRHADLVQRLPRAFAGGRELAASYRIDGQGWVSCAVAGRDARERLRIDPVLVYSTFLGGSGNGDEALSMTIDAAGSVYVTGWATSIDFPTTPRSLQPQDPQGELVAFNLGPSVVTKLSPDGSALVYSTYIGGHNIDAGPGQTPYGNAGSQMVVVDGGAVFLAGQTDEPDFPIMPMPGAFQLIYGGGLLDGYALELSPEGDQLIFSTFLGGPQADGPNTLDLDPAGNLWIGGLTTGDGFPTTSLALQHNYSGSTDSNAFIAELSHDGTSLLYASYLGGSGKAGGDYLEAITELKVDRSGQPAFVGFTNSPDFPGNQMSPSPLRGTGDAFFGKLSTVDGGLLLFTFLGGSGIDYPYGLQLDSAGDAIVFGQTGSSDFPVTSNALQGQLANPQVTNGSQGPFDGFVVVLGPDGGLQYGTYLGGSGDDRIFGGVEDTHGEFHVMGRTSSTDLMTRDPILGEHAETLGPKGLDHYQGGEYDLFVGEFSIDAGYDFLSYLGGSGPEDSYFPYTSLMALDATGATYLVGTSASDDFPTTSHAFQKQRHGAADIDNMVVVKIMPTPPQATITSVTPSEGPTSGISVDVDGTNMSCACEVDFGGIPAQVQCQGAQSGQLDVITGPHACGTFDVTLSCPGSLPSTLPDGFTFIGCPDSGPPDAGPVSDAGPPENASSGSGCGCASTGSPLDAAWVFGFVSLVHRRRDTINKRKTGKGRCSSPS